MVKKELEQNANPVGAASSRPRFKEMTKNDNKKSVGGRIHGEANSRGITLIALIITILFNITILKARRTGNMGKYGRLKLNYMNKYKITEYTEMLLGNELKSYLLDIEDECKEKIDIIIKQMTEKENVIEELKAKNQMEWVQKMNNIKNRAEEIVYSEIIYV